MTFKGVDVPMWTREFRSTDTFPEKLFGCRCSGGHSEGLVFPFLNPSRSLPPNFRVQAADLARVRSLPSTQNGRSCHCWWSSTLYLEDASGPVAASWVPSVCPLGASGCVLGLPVCLLVPPACLWVPPGCHLCMPPLCLLGGMTISCFDDVMIWSYDEVMI